jgi:hypothetical protein
VLDVVAINAAIVALRADQFRSHLTRESPKTIQHLYEEFEKYCHSDNDFRCVWKSNHIKRSLQKLTNLAKESGPIPEMPHTPTLETFSASTARTPRKIPIHWVTPKTKPPARLVHHIQIKGTAAEAEGAATEAEVTAGAEAITRKENGIASSTRRMMIIVQITAQTRKDLRLLLRKKGRRRRGPVP